MHGYPCSNTCTPNYFRVCMCKIFKFMAIHAHIHVHIFSKNCVGFENLCRWMSMCGDFKISADFLIKYTYVSICIMDSHGFFREHARK